MRDIMTFTEFTKYNLGYEDVEKEDGTYDLKMGSVWPIVSYVADLLGAILGTVGVIFVCKEAYPFCSLCKKYKKSENKYEIQFINEEKPVEKIIERLREVNVKEGYKKVISYINDLFEESLDTKGDVKIVIDQRICLSCREGTTLGKAKRLHREEWKEIIGLNFSFSGRVEEQAVADSV